MIPNIITTFRLFLVPLFAYLVIIADNVWGACAVLVISGLSDVVDGFIARHYNMITDVGKVYDPLVDKLMHITVLCSLAACRYIPFWILWVIIIKEVAMIAVSGILYFKKIIIQAKWYGKMATVTFYAVMLMLVLFEGIPSAIKTALLCILVAAMLFAAGGYIYQLISYKRGTKEIC